MSCHLCAWVVFRWHDTAARRHRLADFERIASRSISRGGSYPLGVISEQLRGSPTLWIEATASVMLGRDLCEHAPTTKSEHDGSHGMRPCNRTHRLPHPRPLPTPSSPTRPAQCTSLLEPPRARFSLELLARFLHDPS